MAGNVEDVRDRQRGANRLARGEQIVQDGALAEGGGDVNERIVNFLLENVATKSMPWSARRLRTQ